MISVIRIIGESYDLVTGNESPKSLVLTNGSQEVAIAISDKDLSRVLTLLGADTPVADRPAFEGPGSFSSDEESVESDPEDAVDAEEI